jgi:hypothetical protein
MDRTMATPLITGVDIHSSERSQGLGVGLKTLSVLRNTGLFMSHHIE